MEEKYCPRCQETLPAERFGKNKSKKDGLQSYCKDCSKLSISESHERNPLTRFAGRLRSRYGITVEEYNEILASQGHRCAICRTDTPDARNWHVEHCHDSGKVRGITCHSCNSAIERFREDAELIARAIEYVNRKPLVIPDFPPPQPVTARDASLYFDYRIRVAHFDWLLEQQNFGCAICGEKCSSGKNLAVDHNHGCCPGDRSCGKCLRGLLCQSHNHALGLFKDSPEILRSAIAYLERHSTNKETNALAA